MLHVPVLKDLDRRATAAYMRALLKHGKTFSTTDSLRDPKPVCLDLIDPNYIKLRIQQAQAGAYILKYIAAVYYVIIVLHIAFILPATMLGGLSAFHADKKTGPICL